MDEEGRRLFVFLTHQPPDLIVQLLSIRYQTNLIRRITTLHSTVSPLDTALNTSIHKIYLQRFAGGYCTSFSCKNNY